MSDGALSKFMRERAPLLARAALAPSGADRPAGIRVDLPWLDAMRQGLQGERERLILWGPVGFAAGAALACGPVAGHPPHGWLLTVGGALACAFGFGAAGQRWPHGVIGTLCAALALMCLLTAGFAGGAAAALLRAASVAAPVIPSQTPALSVRGFVETLDRSQSGAWRATLRVHAIEGVPAAAWPHRVRITLRDPAPALPGAAVACVAVLRLPPGPVAPGAYDFARRAWFQRIGAVGYATAPCGTADLGEPDWRFRMASELTRARISAARHIAAVSPTPGGALLAAVATGERGLMDAETTEALQVSGLSHIVSVSGLHVALVSGLVFVVLWRALALVPGLALRLDTRKAAAITAFAIAFAYTVFTGAEAPAVRACVMAGVAFGAIVFNRKAITMRGLAVAAMLVLAVRPESAMEPGFQMSFLATAALVALWEALEKPATDLPRHPLSHALTWLGAAAAASFVAGLATAPVAAATFGRLAPYALPANVLAAPLTDFVVGPFAVLAATLAPFGWDKPFWAVAAWGMDGTVWIAHAAAALPGADARAPWTGPVPPAVLVTAVVWLSLWRTGLRWLGLGLGVAGAVMWAAEPRPVGWIAPGGSAVLATPLGAAASLCGTKGSRFNALRLLDAAGVGKAEADRLAPEGRFRLRPECAVGEGDWEARYLPAQSGPAVLSISLDGRSHAFGPGDLAQGALVLREGWRVRLYAPASGSAPWRREPDTN